MNHKVIDAVERLNSILPLTERQKKLPADIAKIHHDILYSYVELGRSLSKEEISTRIDNVDEVLDMLRKKDMIVLDGQGEPSGVYPFTMEDRIHKISINNHKVRSMCALDALAIAPMFQIKTRIDSECAVSRQPVHIEQDDRQRLDTESSDKICFGISWNSASNDCCASSLCTQMLFLADESIAAQWREEDGENREVFNIDDAIDFAAAFFKPLTDYQIV